MNPQARFKLWFEVDGKPVIGDGRVELLASIDECGSLSEAARRGGISYRQAYNLISILNRRCGVRIVETSIGGKSGGGTRLTGEGQKLVREYVSLKRDLEKRVRAFDKKRPSQQ